MASIHLERTIEASPETCWAALRDWGALHERLVPGFVVDARLEGDDRIVTFFNGAVARERLIDLSDEDRRLVWSIVDGPYTHHNGVAQVFANDDGWLEEILAAAKTSGDHAWPFPLHPRYRRYVDSSFADLKNSSDLRQGSPVLAAEFLREFSGEGPWAHIDMAGPGFLERSRGDYLTQRGGTGYGVRLIVELAQRLST